VELPQWDVKSPSIRSDWPQAICGQIDTFRDSDSRSTSEKQCVCAQVIDAAKFIVQSAIIVWRERFRKELRRYWYILSHDEVCRNEVIGGSQAFEQAPEVNQVRSPCVIRQGSVRMDLAEITEIAEEVGIAA